MLMMLAFGHTFCPKYGDDDAESGIQLPTMRRYQWCWLAAVAFPGALLCHVGRLGFSQAGGPEKQHRQHV